MKKFISIQALALAITLSLAGAANAALCSKHEGHDDHGKSKKAKTASSTSTKKAAVKGKSGSAAVKNPMSQGSMLSSDGSGQDHSAHMDHSDMSSMEETSKSDPKGKVIEANIGMKIPDVEVIDQEGRRVQFYSDLVKGKTVAINFIFTTCTTICTPLGATFASMQKQLKIKKSDVQLISISVDPVTDTPERLKAWQKKFKADGDWTLVTGDKQTIDKLLEQLSASVAKRDDHSAMVLIGNDVTGRWTRTYGLAKPGQILALIEETRTAAPMVEMTSKGGSK